MILLGVGYLRVTLPLVSLRIHFDLVPLYCDAPERRLEVFSTVVLSPKTELCLQAEGQAGLRSEQASQGPQDV